MKTKNVRLMLMTGASILLAVGTTASMSQGNSRRKTTEPPVMTQGRLGQDLFFAIDRRSADDVRALLKKGADANARNGLELTPLHIAAASYQPEVVKALLDAGAAPDAETAYGTPLVLASATGNLQAAKTLLALKADVNMTRLDGITALMMASNAGNPELVSELLQHKADVNATSYRGASALSYAARAGHVPAAKVLIEGGAKVDLADEDGHTPLMHASMGGNSAVVELLLASGAKPNLRDKHKRTALMLAASYGDYPEVVKSLLEAGADAKATDAKGRTAAALAKLRQYRGSSAALGDPSPASTAAAGKIPTTRQAITSSLKAIETSISDFSDKASCISCHHEGLGRMATGAAVASGFSVKEAVLKMGAARVDGAMIALHPLHAQAVQHEEAMKQLPLIEMNEITPIDTWLLSGSIDSKRPANAATASMALVLARQQSPNGSWTFSLPRVPMQSSNFTFTALAARALQTYGPRANREEISDRLAKAQTWLLESEGKSSDDMAFRLLGLKWTGAGLSDRKAAIDQLLAAQQPDGGWAQLPGMPSDAYATGQAVYALRLAGALPVGHKSVAKGTSYLLRTQQPDGTWFVNKRAIPVNNFFDASFPHGESQYSSFNGTSWATLALLQTLPKS